MAFYASHPSRRGCGRSSGQISIAQCYLHQIAWIPSISCHSNRSIWRIDCSYVLNNCSTVDEYNISNRLCVGGLEHDLAEICIDSLMHCGWIINQRGKN